MTVTAYCHTPARRHKQERELVKLRDHFGQQAPARADLLPKLKCAKCGSKKVGLIYAGHQLERLWQGEGQLTSQRHPKANT
ncbi:hypothetical protein NKJ88_01035 [Mesorhizobium sp. M0016]|uniref:hypothetical protein n=1 Tax=Mesorhizobium sp. M0016 TaxID=2956843 RepID=UPI00333CD0A3